MDFRSNRARVVGVTTPTVDFIPNSEGIISYAARVSNPDNQKNFETAAGLLKYCMRNGHWSVFEMANLVIEIETPRDIARQLLRHKSLSFQEYSQRYSKVEDFVVREARLQDVKNRQNSVDTSNEDLIGEWEKRQQEVIDLVDKNYEWALKNGIAKECARVIIPEGNALSYLYANGTVRSWITYLKVRDDEGVTQKEHVDLARKIRIEVLKHFPFLEELI